MGAITAGVAAGVTGVLTLFTGLAAAGEQARAGELESRALLKANDDERIAARDRSLDRRRKLLRVISAQNAQIGASGVLVQGTPGAIQMADREELALEQVRDDATTSARVLNRAKSAQAAARGGVRRGNIGILGSAVTAAGSFRTAVGGTTQKDAGSPAPSGTT